MKSPGSGFDHVFEIVAPAEPGPSAHDVKYGLKFTVMVRPGAGRGLNADGAGHSLLAPVQACVIAAARDMPGVCGVLLSSSPARTTRMPCSFQSGIRFSIRAFRALSVSLQRPRWLLV